MNLLKPILLAALPLVIVAGVGAGAYFVVASDDDEIDLTNGVELAPGRVSCEVFNVARGYKYTTTVVLNLHDRPPGMEAGGTDTYRPEGFTFTSVIDGEVQGTEAVHAHIVYPEQNNQEADYIAMIKTDTLYSMLPGGEWTSAKLSESQFQIPYIPNVACNALAPDLFLSDIEGTPEEINGIAATRYHFEPLVTDFNGNHPAFGAGSDAGRFVKEFTGDIWIAEDGGYLLKMDLVGLGQYENGRVLEVDFAYEMTDVNAKIEIKAPI